LTKTKLDSIEWRRKKGRLPYPVFLGWNRKEKRLYMVKLAWEWELFPFFAMIAFYIALVWYREVQRRRWLGEAETDAYNLRCEAERRLLKEELSKKRGPITNEEG
jgi:hypothetical protein